MSVVCVILESINEDETDDYATYISMTGHDLP